MIPIKIPVGFFVEIEPLNLKFLWKFKGHRIGNNLEEKNKVGGFTLLNLKTFCKATVIKILWYIDKQKRI